MFNEHEKFVTDVFMNLGIAKNTPKYNLFKEIVIEIMPEHNNTPILLLNLYEKLVNNEFNRLFNKCMVGNLDYKTQDVKRDIKAILKKLAQQMERSGRTELSLEEFSQEYKICGEMKEKVEILLDNCALIAKNGDKYAFLDNSDLKDYFITEGIFSEVLAMNYNHPL